MPAKLTRDRNTPTSGNAFTYSSVTRVTEGQVIKFGGWVYRESGDDLVRWKLKVMDASQAPIAYPGSYNAGSGLWEYHEHSYTVPSGAAYVQLYAEIYQATTASVARFDDGFMDGSVRYSFSDQLGTSRLVTDAAGTPCYNADFYPYGVERAYSNTCPQPLRFGGYEYDSESGFYNAFARYYDPGRGRFISADPLGGGVGNPQSHNGYAYVLNNPVNLIDPTGLCGESPEGGWSWNPCIGIEINFSWDSGGGGHRSRMRPSRRSSLPQRIGLGNSILPGETAGVPNWLSGPSDLSRWIIVNFHKQGGYIVGDFANEMLCLT